MLFISWENYIPAYVRASSRKTGRVIDENGVVAEQHNEDADNADMANSAADATASNERQQ
jgi:hypothetical protein